MMRNGQLIGLPENLSTWILVATRKKAQFFKSLGGTKNLKQVTELDSPEHKDNDVHHIVPLFAEKIVGKLEKARSEGDFSRLILVCEPKLLGEIRKRLNAKTLSLLEKSVHKVLNRIDEGQLRARMLSWA